jgi:lipopolysaccharide transport system ATP-binding protein
MTLLRAEGLGKAYRMYRRPLDSLKELFLGRDYSTLFWAVRDVEAQVDQGGSLGIIGDNGAGKSTLLRLLAGAAAPSTGHVTRTGRITTILTLGAGFHPDLTGTENIRIGCAVLGFSPGETEALIPRIVAFSELGDFIDRPVRTYSSGMYLRLGFSVATAVNPDLVIVDEHLSVGDQHFRLKCKRRIMELRAEGCGIVLCSHDLGSIVDVCDRTLWLEHGRPRMFGESQQVREAYLSSFKKAEAESPAEAPRRVPALNFLKEVSLVGGSAPEFESGDQIRLRIVATLTDSAFREGISVAVVIVRNDGVRCYGTSTRVDDAADCLTLIREGDYGVTFVIDAVPLLAGNYFFLVALQDHTSSHSYDWIAEAAPFVVKDEGRDAGVARIPHHWEQP